MIAEGKKAMIKLRVKATSMGLRESVPATSL